MGLRSQAVTTAVGALFLAVAFTGLVGGFAPDANAHEIHVTLFGQPCVLQGPPAIDVQMLKTIHAISPEQIYPDFEPEGKPGPFQAAIDKLRMAKTLPDDFDVYKEQLGKRLEAQAAFLNGLAEAQRTKRADPLMSNIRKYISSETKQKSLETGAKKLETNLTSAQRKDVVEQLFNTFSEIMPSDPEEEFHLAIHRLKIQYVCAFEDSGEGSGSHQNGSGD